MNTDPLFLVWLAVGAIIVAFILCITDRIQTKSYSQWRKDTDEDEINLENETSGYIRVDIAKKRKAKSIS